MNKNALRLPLLVAIILLSCSSCGSLKKTKCKECPVFSQYTHNNPYQNPFVVPGQQNPMPGTP